jgi:hypothetical protein
MYVVLGPWHVTGRYARPASAPGPVCARLNPTAC